MARLVLCVVALVACGLADPIPVPVQQKNVMDPAVAKRQVDLSVLYYHVHEPLQDVKYKEIAKTWDMEKNIGLFKNETAVQIYLDILKNDWTVPRGIPFAVLEYDHNFDAVTLFNVLYSAKDYDTFFKTAVYLRDRVNEQLFIYVLSAAIMHRHDTQGVVVPPLYEVFPSFFNNAEIMTTAQRISTHGFSMIENYPSTYKWDDSIVIKSNFTSWPYYGDSTHMSYFTEDHGLNALYYNYYLMYPQWLGGDVIPLYKDTRGEVFWFVHSQFLARYYMERLSNGLGEIPDLDTKLFKEGYTSGLMYYNGIPFPSRPNNFLIDQPDFAEKLEEATEYERRIRDAIDKGYIITHDQKRVDLLNTEAIDILGRMIECSVDSPNSDYYKDFISIWKSLLGNSYLKEYQYANEFVPKVVPSLLENYQTAIRDPAFFSIWKRVLSLFTLWHQRLPHYTTEELSLPSVNIEKVEVDKLVTYFENTYVNISNHLHTKPQSTYDEVSVLVQRPRLNHKVFNVRVHVKSEVAKPVVVRFFLAPKYDGKGFEIPLHTNSENFFLMDAFPYNLPAGESVITRDSSENMITGSDWYKAYDVFLKAEKAVNGAKPYVVEQTQRPYRFPQRLLLPKGRVGGMPFVFLVYISEYRAPDVPFGTGFDPNFELGLGTGAIRYNKETLGFPFDRPLNPWQIQGFKNFHFEDVLIYHKQTEVVVPHNE